MFQKENAAMSSVTQYAPTVQLFMKDCLGGKYTIHSLDTDKLATGAVSEECIYSLNYLDGG